MEFAPRTEKPGRPIVRQRKDLVCWRSGYYKSIAFTPGPYSLASLWRCEPTEAWFDITLLLVGGCLSLSTSWLLASRLERIGERLGLSEAFLGLLAALAADSPEITSAVTALVRHQHAVGVGVVIGSNVFNLAALLGLGAVTAGRIHFHRSVVALSGAVALWISLLSLGVIQGSVAPPIDFTLMLGVFVPYIVLLSAHRSLLSRLPVPARWRQALGRAISEEEQELAEAIQPQPGHLTDLVIAFASIVIILGASVAMEWAGTALGNHFAIPEIIIGGLVLAVVTSLPNALVAIFLASRGRGAATLSIALNSNSINVIAGLLIPSLVVGASGASDISVVIGVSYVGLTAVTLLFAFIDRGLRRSSGFVIIGAYALFVAILLVIS